MRATETEKCEVITEKIREMNGEKAGRYKIFFVDKLLRHLCIESVVS